MTLLSEHLKEQGKLGVAASSGRRSAALRAEPASQSRRYRAAAANAERAS